MYPSFCTSPRCSSRRFMGGCGLLIWSRSWTYCQTEWLPWLLIPLRQVTCTRARNSYIIMSVFGETEIGIGCTVSETDGWRRELTAMWRREGGDNHVRLVLAIWSLDGIHGSYRHTSSCALILRWLQQQTRGISKLHQVCHGMTACKMHRAIPSFTFLSS
jgi:hypothetical protein